eukprot:s6221_g4.t1
MGVRGTRESENIKDSTSVQGSVQDMEQCAKPGQLDEWRLDDLGTCEVESGVDKVSETILRHMQESVASRDKLSKFVEKLDEEVKKMNDVIAALGVLYDDLAKLQADAKIQKFSDAHPALMVHVIYLMPGNTCEGQAIPNPSRMTMATSLEVKNKMLGFNSHSQATAKHVATIAKAFAGDISTCKALKDLARAPLNDAEKSLQAVVKRWSLNIDVPLTYVDVGNDCRIPMLLPADYIRTLRDAGYLNKLLGSSRLAEFWENFRGEQPTHEVFDHGHFIDYSSLVPLYLHGDGGRTYKRDELMVIQFQPVLGFGSRLSHPNKFGQQTGINLQGHSFTTRFLTGVMPKQMYRDSLDVFDNFMVHTMSSLESLYYQGLQLPHGRVLRFLVVGLKGDLPFLAKAGHLNRTFSNIRKAPERPTSKPLVGCCWMCGAGSPNIPFEDFGTAPRWLGTCGANNALPWHSMPPWFDHVPAHVHEDRGSFFKLDILHIYHLGVGRDFGGSSKYPTGHWSKASDTPVLVQFVFWILQQHPAEVAQSRMLQVMSSASEAIGIFMRELLQAPLWLSPEQAQRAGEASLHFLQCYAKSVDIFYRKAECKFNLVPKLHCLHHLSLGLLDSASTGKAATNPLSYSCFQDEDFIGRVSRLSRRISPKLLVRRTLQRYLIATKYQLSDSK